MARSVAIVGAGQIGYQANFAFVDRGWSSKIHARSKPNWKRYGSKFIRHDIASDPAPRADCVVDTIAFDAGDVERYDPERVGRLILISSASVYSDAHGRTLDEARENGFPIFDGPISEAQQTVAPGPETYSTRKIRMEQRAVELFGERVTILRPCAIYGKWSRHPREWWFVKRLLDRRTVIPLLRPAHSRFQPTDAEDIGIFAVDAAEHELSGIFNIADDDCPDVTEIGDTIASYMDREVRFVALAEEAEIGRTPWSIPRPFIISSQKAANATGHIFSRYYPGALHAVEWLSKHRPSDWRAAFPQLAAYPWDLFDYAAEDRVLASL